VRRLQSRPTVKGAVDHTIYDTGSIARLITRWFGLEKLPALVEREQAMIAAGGPPPGDLTGRWSWFTVAPAFLFRLARTCSEHPWRDVAAAEWASNLAPWVPEQESGGSGKRNQYVGAG